MKLQRTLSRYTPLALAVLMLGSLGCATKGYVRESVAPIDTRVTEVEAKSTDNSTKIAGLESRVDKDVSRLEERTRTNERAAAEAAEQAARANSQAEQADERAGQAHTLAEEGLTRVDGLQRVVENLDSYQLVSNETLLFKLNSAQLTDEAKAQLDSAIARINGMSHYVLEVKGFTDTTGPSDYNIQLSQRRAEAVVRYLTTKDVPLHRIHVLGLGSETPAADNKTREGRQENRRVELKLFVADVDTATARASS